VVTDASGTVAQTLDFYPYGATRISNGTGASEKRQFIGQFSDDSGLSYLQARYYDTARGQFLTQDPVFLGDPRAQNLTNPQSLNSYSYANDNPITSKDPEGDASISDLLGQLAKALTALCQYFGGCGASSGSSDTSQSNSATQTRLGHPSPHLTGLSHSLTGTYNRKRKPVVMMRVLAW
jgi:RHS repeat-associated protein